MWKVFENIILALGDMINELQNLQFESLNYLFMRMIYSLLFILLLIGILQSVSYIIVYIYKFIYKINIQQLLIKLLGE